MMNLGFAPRAPLVVVVSHRAHDGVWRHADVEMHVQVVSDVVELNRTHERHHVALTVLDTAVPDDTRYLTAAGAALWVASRSDRRMMVALDGTDSGDAMGEEVGETLRVQRRVSRLAAVTCGRSVCVVRAAATAVAGEHWQEPSSHVRPDPLRISKPILFNELTDKQSFVGAILLDVAARPHATWADRAAALHFSPGATRNRLSTTIKPALVRLGWIGEHQTLNTNLLTFLVAKRYGYIRRFVLENRPDMRDHFEPGPDGRFAH